MRWSGAEGHEQQEGENGAGKKPEDLNGEQGAWRECQGESQHFGDCGDRNRFQPNV